MTRFNRYSIIYLFVSVLCLSLINCQTILQEEGEVVCAVPGHSNDTEFVLIESINGTEFENKTYLFGQNSTITFKNNTRVLYKCVADHSLLIGNQYRECIDGKWTGKPPICGLDSGTNLKSNIGVLDIKTGLSIFNVPLTYGFNRSGDNKCFDWAISRQQRWIITLSDENREETNSNNLFLFGFHGYDIRNRFRTDFNLKVHRLLTNNEMIECKPKSDSELKFWKQNDSNYLLQLYSCYYNSNGTAQDDSPTSVSIEFSQNPRERISISLCDFKRYHLRDYCRAPDPPLGGFWESSQNTTTKESYYNLKCSPNYNIQGSEQVKCGSTGQLLNELPTCKRQYCRAIKLDDQDFTKRHYHKDLLIEYKTAETLSSEPTNIKHFKKIVFSCNKNVQYAHGPLYLQGKSNFNCENGVWLGLNHQTVPECTQNANNSGDEVNDDLDEPIGSITSSGSDHKTLANIISSIVYLVLYLFI